MRPEKESSNSLAYSETFENGSVRTSTVKRANVQSQAKWTRVIRTAK